MHFPATEIIPKKTSAEQLHLQYCRLHLHNVGYRLGNQHLGESLVSSIKHIQGLSRLYASLGTVNTRSWSSKRFPAESGNVREVGMLCFAASCLKGAKLRTL